jgi:hypothetical protein
MGANQAPLLEALLAQPQWLHNKLRAYGVASLVSDFRRYSCHHRVLASAIDTGKLEAALQSCFKGWPGHF